MASAVNAEQHSHPGAGDPLQGFSHDGCLCLILAGRRGARGSRCRGCRCRPHPCGQDARMRLDSLADSPSRHCLVLPPSAFRSRVASTSCPSRASGAERYHRPDDHRPTITASVQSAIQLPRRCETGASALSGVSEVDERRPLAASVHQ